MTKKHIQITNEYSLIEDIFQAYYDARKNKRNSNSALEFELEYEKNLVKLYREINDRSYKPKPYSAFIIEKQEVAGSLNFILIGAGWGHGVGLCQIGAAVMGDKGYSYHEILLHYFRGAGLEHKY